MRLERITLIGLVSVATAACAPAFAEHQYDGPYYDRYDSRYAGDDYAYARVVYVEPIVRFVRVQTPRRDCYDDVEYYHDDYDRPRRGTAGATIAGGLIGGLVGRQFGGGDGRDAATLVGTLVGSSVANDRAHRRQDRRYVQTRSYPVERCHVSHASHEEERIDGYRVTYEYDGHEYTTRTQQHPGERIRVRVAVTPVDTY